MDFHWWLVPVLAFGGLAAWTVGSANDRLDAERSREAARGSTE